MLADISLRRHTALLVHRRWARDEHHVAVPRPGSHAQDRLVCTRDLFLAASPGAGGDAPPLPVEQQSGGSSPSSRAAWPDERTTERKEYSRSSALRKKTAAPLRI